MILHFNYEELRALSSAIEFMVGDVHAGGSMAVAAPPETVALVENLLPRLTGDVSIETLEDQRRVRLAVGLVVDDLHRRMDDRIIEYYPAHEEAVNLYFDYGHSRSVLARLDGMGAEMQAILELISGGHPDPSLASTVTFPD